mmetsp:Transcript_13119/g.37886  ORF Transcript_13119/g.37886 Transcript_13119/m.37886 type:complete len:173 (-) Transcript_13119:21-539(-)
MSSKGSLLHISRQMARWAGRGQATLNATNLASVSAQRIPLSQYQSVRRASNHVVDSVVNFSVIDRSGKVHALRGLEGQTVADVFAQNTDVLGADCVAGSPEGRGRVEAHVKVPSEWFGAVGADEGEAREVLEELVGDTGLDGHSRLGSRVVLGKALEGMTVSVGGVYPWKSL